MEITRVVSLQNPDVYWCCGTRFSACETLRTFSSVEGCLWASACLYAPISHHCSVTAHFRGAASLEEGPKSHGGPKNICRKWLIWSTWGQRGLWYWSPWLKGQQLRGLTPALCAREPHVPTAFIRGSYTGQSRNLVFPEWKYMFTSL